MSKTALITGATSGIGAVYAKRLASQGYNLILTGRRQAIIEKLADDLSRQFNIKAQVIIAELTDDAHVQRVVDAIKTAENLEILINNAGILRPGMVYKLAEDDWEGWKLLQKKLGDKIQDESK